LPFRKLYPMYIVPISKAASCSDGDFDKGK